MLSFTVQGNDKSTKHEVALKLKAADITKITSTTGETFAASSHDLTIDTTGTLANMVGKLADGTTDNGITFKAGTTVNTIEIEATGLDTGDNLFNKFEILDMRVRRGHTKDLHGVGVATQTAANSAITALDTAIQAVNEQRASYGSYISRWSMPQII